MMEKQNSNSICDVSWNDHYSIWPQRFYLFSHKSRRLFSYESADRRLENEVEEAFGRLPKKEGGNVHAVFIFEASMLEVMTDLSERMKADYPQIQQLPAFFRQLQEGDIFIRHKAWAPLCDLKRSIIHIKAIEKGREPKYDDDIFVLNWGILYVKFETYSYGFLTDKIYVGEDDPGKRVCRFCGESGKDRFKHESHAIMEGLGNKLLYCNEECDKCNQDFERDVENHLFKFLEVNRTLSNVSGKGSRNHHLEGLNFHIHPDPKTLKPVIYIMQDKIINDAYKGMPTGKVLLFNNGEISYHGIYKALVKIAVDMIPLENKGHFRDTGRWVHGDNEGGLLPTFLYGEHQDFFEQPVLDLFFKNEKSPYFSPYCTAVLYVFSSLFIFTVPFNDVDGNNYSDGELLSAHWAFFKKEQYLYVAEWEEFDANDKELNNPFYKIPLLPTLEKYRVEFKPSTDEVFKIERG